MNKFINKVIDIKFYSNKYKNLNKNIYNHYLDSNINLKDYNVHLFANIKNIISYEKDFKSIYYYSNDTHYPYEDKYLRNLILKY